MENMARLDFNRDGMRFGFESDVRMGDLLISYAGALNEKDARMMGITPALEKKYGLEMLWIEVPADKDTDENREALWGIYEMLQKTPNVKAQLVWHPGEECSTLYVYGDLKTAVNKLVEKNQLTSGEAAAVCTKVGWLTSIRPGQNAGNNLVNQMQQDRAAAAVPRATI